MKYKIITALLCASTLAANIGRAQSTATISIQANQPGAIVSSNLFGIFFEEINYGGEGGIYAEMVRNRAFYNGATANFWTLVTQGTAAGSMTVDSAQPLNTNIPNSLNLTMSSGTGSVGAGNSGFWGMSLQSGATYDLSFYAMRSNNYAGSINARLESADGATVYAQTSLSGLTTGWNKFSASLVPNTTDTSARLVLSISQAGTVWLDVVSLFPHATFNNRTNGLRLDLGNKLADVKPSFMRFPGGNYIESTVVSNAVRWKKSVGDIAQRPGHMNDSWGYWSTDGFGAHEFFQFCEDTGMEPLYGINAGLMLGYNGSTNNTVPLDQMGPWVQDALDLIEYANGDTSTTYGAMRAANGHPAPFNLKYMEIGNENGGSYYNDRYTLFYDAIKAKYPDMHLIACGNWGGGMPWSRPVEIEDEHYYSSPGTFIGYATKYDNYSRTGPKVFVGEYAVTSGYGTYGNLSAALGEATFMTGMERNADIVAMACYAPLFANVNGIQWHPDLIYFDNYRSFGTPAYYVQKMFSNHRGDAILPTSVSVGSSITIPAPQGAIGLGSWNTSVQYTNIVVTSNSVTLYQSDFIANGTNGWRVHNGTWSTNAGLYQQTSASTIDCRSTTGNTNWSNYTISLRARRVSGSEGFLILFNWTDDNNWTWWNVGGWNNTLDGIEQNVGGSKTTLAQVSQTAITNNGWYDISVAISNYTMRCYLNGTLKQTVNYSSNATTGVYASATYKKSSNQIIIKAVNPYSVPVSTTFNLGGVNSVAPTGSVVQLSSANATDENSLTSPTYVSPVTNTITGVTTSFGYTLPAYSLSILKLTTADINNYTNLLLQVASPIYAGQSVTSAVWAAQSGTWYDLTANANRALTWFSLNTNVATVDVSGNVRGVASGTTSIVAGYPALSLYSTQVVQIISVPATLVHRYSFSETSGTNVTDSVGGPAWGGTLPRGGTFGGGQLMLSSNSQQYVNLPGGILSNYTQVTIEAWLSYPSWIGNNAFFYGFGNISGNTGYNYIFCAPKAGRIAITGASYGAEQNANANADFGYRTNLHFVAVYNPPAGYLALYTNGVLAAINNSVTTAFTSVNNIYSFIGRSLYSGDPYADLTLDEFRIYSGALSQPEIAAAQMLGQDQLLSSNPPLVSVAPAAGNFVFNWPLDSAGYTIQSTTNLVFGTWTDVPSASAVITNGQWQITLPAAGNSVFYRLRK